MKIFMHNMIHTYCLKVFFCRYLWPPGNDFANSVLRLERVGPLLHLEDSDGDPLTSSHLRICAINETTVYSVVYFLDLIKNQNKICTFLNLFHLVKE